MLQNAASVASLLLTAEALSHVVNFDVPAEPDSYIHRVGRTGRAEMTGEAFTFVAPQEEGDWRAIERAIGRSLPRVTLPDFNYQARAARPLEVPHAQRIAEIRARKAEERARARKNAARSDGASPRAAHAPRSTHAGPPRGGRFRPRTGRRRP